MTHTGDDPRLNPFSRYRTMRQTQPVGYDAHHSSWGAFRYEDVQQVLSNYAAFSSAQMFGEASSDGSQPFAASLLSLDPPRHRQLRALVTQAFTPRAIETLTPRISTIVEELLDQIGTRAQFDAIHDLAAPLPVIVIAELLGIPVADRARFKQWSDAVVSFATTGGMSGFQAEREMVQYFRAIIAQRRRAPSDDLISRLLQVEVDGEQLTIAEMMGFCALLLVAGNETTTHLLGNALLCFDEYPDVWARLRATPALVPQAIEEVIRYRSPVQCMFRRTTAPVTLGGTLIPNNTNIIAWIGSGNRDEQQFERANEFDLDRHPNRHLGFGYGIHYCLGAPLARLEAKLALSALLARYRTVRRAPHTPLVALPSLLIYGVQRLPVTVT